MVRAGDIIDETDMVIFQVSCLMELANFTYPPIDELIAKFGGTLSAAVSLVSMFLPPRLLRFLILVPWTFLPIIIAYQIHYVLIHHACHRLQQKIKNIVSKFSDVCSTGFGFNASSSNEQP
ncbi:hypothetical protein LWI28_002025 [Acer negundo]|uniref:Uncharacterized protein n=1 Tax=Acer negundo TaxID=4023 RepID=A0AAD5J8G8_ACENE|nr:hypothetical protein LWI28_002025 [Acer negundo]KAK4853789.1 hypothetical protein QYF36_014663 [Acer negundo]